MVTKITNRIKVSVETFFQEQYSNPLAEEFMFAYQIRIFNGNDFPVQLIRRHWEIIDSNGEHREVKGEGVVGRQPVLFQDEEHQYVSGCNLHSSIGKMRGTYTFENKLTHEEFQVNIPEFMLVAPMRLN